MEGRYEEEGEEDDDGTLSHSSSEDSMGSDFDLPLVNDSGDEASEVDSESNSGAENEGVPLETGLHSYMGSEMNELSGRQIHEDGAIVILPLFYQSGVIIVPGQILPLNLFHPQPIDMMKKVVAADKTFGLVIKRTHTGGDESVFLASVGVTCEIFSFREYEEYGYTKVSLKAEGRQRFKILSKHSQLDGVIMGKVEILPETPIYSHPASSLIYTLHQQPNSIRSQVLANRCYLEKSPWKNNEQRYMAGFSQKTAGGLFSSVTHLPGWVYKFYNPYFLMDCLVREIRSWNDNLDLEILPTNPVEFSHWMTANLPLTTDMKIDLLTISSAPMRMQKLIRIMSKCGSSLACASCEQVTIITDKKELFSLSKRSPMAAYVNPNGHVHETATFYKAQNVLLTGRSSTQYSWFPGYAWTIASCKRCHTHLGWKFTAVHKGSIPSKFWGLTRKSLRPIFKDDTMSSEPSETNVYGALNIASINQVQLDSDL